jgi:DNA-binding SARP family transcriptional activator
MDLGLIYMHLGQYKQANIHNQEALEEWEKANNITQQANLLNNMGVLANLQGNYKQAKEYFEQALTCARESGYRRMEGFVLTSLGDLYADLEAYTAVKENYNQAQEIALDIGDQYLINYIDITQASLAKKLQKHVQAHHLLDDIEPYIEESGSSYESGLLHLERGKLYLAEEKSEKAIPLLESAVRDFESGGQRVECAQAHLYLAQAYDNEGNKESSVHHVSKAIQTTSILESLHPLIHSGREVKSALRAAQSSPQVGDQVSILLDAIRDFEKELPSLQFAIYEDEAELELFIPGLTIQTMGRAQVKRHGKVVSAPEFTNQRAVRELFFFLLIHPDGLRKRAIGQALWPESSPEEFKRQFKNAVYRLRRALGKEIVIYDQGEKRYRFNWSLDYRYDVEDFRTQLSRAHNSESEKEQISALDSALSLYRHPYLPRVSHLWVEPIRNRLFRQYKDAVLTLAEIYLDGVMYEKAVQTCQHLISIDPCQERAHRLSMRAHAALGDRAAVARQYQSCRKALSEDLDTSPSPETEELYHRLMDLG